MANYDMRNAVYRCGCCNEIIRTGEEYFDLRVLGFREIVCTECIDLAHFYDAEREMDD